MKTDFNINGSNFYLNYTQVLCRVPRQGCITAYSMNIRQNWIEIARVFFHYIICMTEDTYKSIHFLNKYKCIIKN